MKFMLGHGDDCCRSASACFVRELGGKKKENSPHVMQMSILLELKE